MARRRHPRPADLNGARPELRSGLDRRSRGRRAERCPTRSGSGASPTVAGCRGPGWTARREPGLLFDPLPDQRCSSASTRRRHQLAAGLSQRRRHPGSGTRAAGHDHDGGEFLELALSAERSRSSRSKSGAERMNSTSLGSSPARCRYSSTDMTTTASFPCLVTTWGPSVWARSTSSLKHSFAAFSCQRMPGLRRSNSLDGLSCTYRTCYRPAPSTGRVRPWRCPIRSSPAPSGDELPATASAVALIVSRCVTLRRCLVAAASRTCHATCSVLTPLTPAPLPDRPPSRRRSSSTTTTQRLSPQADQHAGRRTSPGVPSQQSSTCDWLPGLPGEAMWYCVTPAWGEETDAVQGEKHRK